MKLRTNKLLGKRLGCRNRKRESYGVCRQTTHHTYGSDENEEITDEDDPELLKGTALQHGSKSVSSARCRSKCKCGLTEYKNINYCNCSLNKKKHSEVDDSNTVTTDGSTTVTINKDSSEEEI